MKKWLTLAILTIILTPPAAFAYLDEVQLPATAETGVVVSGVILGSMPDSCWEFLDMQVGLADFTVTIELWTAHTAPPDVGCLLVITPFEAHPEFQFLEPGEWTVQVVEHASHPIYGDSEWQWEGTITVTGVTPLEPTTWAGLKACYR